MGSVIFVHGTGVRAESYEQSFQTIEKSLAAMLPGWQPVRCYWGEPYGAQLHQHGDSIPTYATTRAVGETVSEEDEALALWEMLYQDPWYELRLLAATGAAPGDELAPGETPPWQQVQERIEQFQPDQALRALLAQNGLADFISDALTQLTSDGIFAEAIQRAADDAMQVAIIARALTAELIVLGQAQGVLPVSGDVRDEIVGHLVAQLGGSSRSIFGWVSNPLKGLALRVATRQFERKRGALSDTAAPVAGDILLYQTRGADIRAFIRSRLTGLPEPVVILAHSLGGIACVDLLVIEKLPHVKALITAGSQAPLLYEIDSLTSLRYGQKLPTHFPRWLNVYDRRDLLSYVGGQVFAGRVEDFEVQHRQPFPQSHSAYWTNKAMWQKIAGFIA